MAVGNLHLQETNIVGTVTNATLATTGLTVDVIFTDNRTGAAREPDATTLLFTFAKDQTTFETILADSHSTTDGITTITINSSGRLMPKVGTGLGGATGFEHPIGTEVGCVNITLIANEIVKILDGTNATSGENWRIGNDANNNITIYAENGDANPPFIRYVAASNKWLISNDGTNTFDPEAGGSGLTAGDGIGISGGAINVDTSDTNIFVKASSGAGDADKAPILNASGKLAAGFILAAGLATYISDVTATASEINQALSGIDGNVTAANLITLTGGAGNNADALHTHSNPAISLIASEAISIDDAVAQLPVQVEWYTQLTDSTLQLGDDNARRRYAVAFTPTRTVDTLTDIKFRARESVNGATNTGTMTVSIQTDSGSEPSGTAVTNATATFPQATQRTWTATMGTRTATFAGNVQLTAGTTYWLVWEVAATDATNYILLSENSSHNENYITFTRLTYDLDAGTWGNSTTSATPFFWGNTEDTPFGLGIVPTDANWGARTWNFVGFAKAGGAAGASIDVYYDIVPDLSLTRGESYYLSTTAGKLTTSPSFSVHDGTTEPTSFVFKVGRALPDGTSLKIELGEKRVIAQETSSISATTIRQYVTWFKPVHVRTTGVMHEAGGDAAMSHGYVSVSGSDASVAVNVNNGAASTSGASVTESIYSNVGTNEMRGAGSALTDVGLTYTYTESGTVAASYAILEILG